MLRNGAPLNKIKVIPHGIPSINVNKITEVKKYIEVSKEKKPVKFFYVGRICREKGVHVMLEAFNNLTLPAEIHVIGGTGNHLEENYLKYLKKIQKRKHHLAR
ncbi:glycosyltransferase [Polaribacter sejongensis]|uniref:glycosyltransferase n=1 Tax=Polaribacter sejongensis TaxID=985043 RepID=UPI0035A71163